MLVERKPIYSTEDYFMMEGFDSFSIYKKATNKIVVQLFCTTLKDAITEVDKLQGEK